MPTPGVQYPTNSIPLYDDGDEITCTVAGAAGHAVPGSRFVKIAGQGPDDNPFIDLATAGADVFGVTAYDAVAVATLDVNGGGDAGGHVTVYHAKHKVVQVKCGAVALTAGEKVMSDATGQAVLWAGTGNISAGIAVKDCAIGAQAAIDLSVGAGQTHA